MCVLLLTKGVSLAIKRSWVDWIKKVNMFSDCGVLGQGRDH